MYIAMTAPGVNCPHNACNVDSKALIRECFKVRGYNENRFGQLEDNIEAYKKRVPIPIQNLTNDTAELDRLWDELFTSCIPILLELTPSCDFAQRTQQLARFAGGVLISGQLARKISDGDSVKRIDPIKVPGKEGIWYPAISGRFPFSMPWQNVGRFHSSGFDKPLFLMFRYRSRHRQLVQDI